MYTHTPLNAYFISILNGHTHARRQRVVLTCDTTVALEHALYIRLGALEGVEVAHEGPGVDSLRILRIGLVPHLTHLALTRHSSTQLW